MLSFHTTKLYNIVNYTLREKEYKSYRETEKEYKRNWHCDHLHNHNRQHCLKVLEQNWNAFFNVKRDYEKNSSKYLAKPNPPTALYKF